MNDLQNSPKWKDVELTFQEPQKEEVFLKTGETIYPFKISGYFFAGKLETKELVHKIFRETFPDLRFL